MPTPIPKLITLPLPLPLLLLILTLIPVAQPHRRPQYLGCFSHPGPLRFEADMMFQTVGYCAGRCGGGASGNHPFFAGLTNGSSCLCGGAMPDVADLAPEEDCDVRCPGYVGDFCGGEGFYSVYASIERDEAGPQQSTNIPSPLGQTPLATDVALLHRGPAGSGPASGSCGGGLGLELN
ncbi:hypothetical protein F4778DRAFT_779029 [Xylariomycetidae sp. FL2044]|nr:hypothetical protein F4778DRAFT_779029 [Xylariomycetidae sp. FL2044]